MSVSALRIDRFLRQGSYWLLFMLALTVPSLDQPSRSIALLLLLAVFARCLLPGTLLLRELDIYDYSLIALALAALLSTVFGLPSSGRYHGLAEALGHLVTFVAIRHGHYSNRMLQKLGAALVAGTVIAGILALHAYFSHQVWPISLPAITGTIRSSLYIGIALFLAIGLILEDQGTRRWILLAAALFLAVILLSMTSRAVIVAFVSVLILAAAVSHRRRTFLLLGTITGILFAAYFAMPESNIKKQIDLKANEMMGLVTSGTVSDNDRIRIDHWRIALAWIETGNHWLFGVGPCNFRSIDTDKLQFTPPLYFPAETREPLHAHNMYLTKYVEEGLVGLATMLALFALIAWRLLLDALAKRTSWAWWGALGGLLLPCTNGMVGSPWFREYALLATLTFGLYLAVRGSTSNSNLNLGQS